LLGKDFAGGALSETIGHFGQGTFTQTGGTNKSGPIYIARSTGSVGAYSITGGVASVKGDVNIGGSASAAGGTGTLSVGGVGQLTVSGRLRVWNGPGNALALSGGGSITVGAIDLSANNPALLNWTGGALKIVGGGGGTGASNVNFPLTVPVGASLTVNGTGQLTVGGAIKVTNGPGTSFNLGGGTVSASAVDLSGNSSLFNWTGGTLRITGAGSSFGGTLTVPNGGVLGGGGIITDPVVVSPGGKLSPGGSPGILSTGSITFSSGSTLVEEVNGNQPGVGGYDQLNVTGSVNLGGATLNLLLGFAPNVGDNFVIVDNDGTDPVLGTFANLPQGGTITAVDPLKRGDVFQISYTGRDGNDVVLSMIATPEPGALAFAVIAGMGALGRRRCRRYCRD
jgi:hypothetical protein